MRVVTGVEVATRTVAIPGRGTTSVLECPGPPGAPTVLLLHGATMTAELGWAQVAGLLGRSFHVVAPDLRGHGDGIPLERRFSLEECADDVAALAAELGVEQCVVVGYSMGGAVAQLLWRRHPDLVAGLVLCATGRSFLGTPLDRLLTWSLPAVPGVLGWSPISASLTADVLHAVVFADPRTANRRGWVRAQLDRTSLGNALAGVHAVSDFTSHDWVGRVDVPTVVIVTTHDTMVPPTRQRRLARAIPGAVLLAVDAGHDACVAVPELFGPVLLQACRAVRADAAGATPC